MAFPVAHTIFYNFICLSILELRLHGDLKKNSKYIDFVTSAFDVLFALDKCNILVGFEDRLLSFITQFVFRVSQTW